MVFLGPLDLEIAIFCRALQPIDALSCIRGTDPDLDMIFLRLKRKEEEKK